MENIDIELFITLVKGYTFLYDKGSKGYKDVVRKENAWKEIAETLNTTVDICIKQFNSLKDKYTRERKKLSVSSGSGASSCPKWVWYEEMQFLNKHIQQRRQTVTNVSNMSSCSNSQPTASVGDEEEVVDEFLGCEDTQMSEYSDHESSEVITIEVGNTDTPKHPKRSNTSIPATQLNSRKKNPLFNNRDIDLKIVDTLENLNKKPRHEEAAFGEVVATELGRISDISIRNKKKMKIMEILYLE